MKPEGVCCLQVPVISWFDDMSDSELLNLIPFFEALADIDSVYTMLDTARHADTVACSPTNHVNVAAISLMSSADDDDSGGIDITVSTVDDSVPQDD